MVTHVLKGNGFHSIDFKDRTVILSESKANAAYHFDQNLQVILNYHKK